MIDSLTPVDGFRSYASLEARLQSLALESGDLSAHDVGRTTDDLRFRIKHRGVVEADLRRPRLAEYLGIEGAVGLTDALVGRAGPHRRAQVVSLGSFR